jgi:HSP20 family protein
MEAIMANLTRYNPVDDVFDDLFRGFLMRPVRMEGAPEIQVKLDVKENEKVLHTERYYGKVSRSFTLAQDVDKATSQTKYNDGILELTLQKKAASISKWLTIH